MVHPNQKVLRGGRFVGFVDSYPHPQVTHPARVGHGGLLLEITHSPLR
eukprot:COSAG01_NODE_55974_length_321_cov_1.319820_1_plen_47_part_10